MRFVSRPLPLDDSRLQQGVDEHGKAVISRWWWVWFFEGTREQQEARLEELRQGPQFYKPLNENEDPVRFQGGAVYEDAFRRIEEKKAQSRTEAAERFKDRSYKKSKPKNVIDKNTAGANFVEMPLWLAWVL